MTLPTDIEFPHGLEHRRMRGPAASSPQRTPKPKPPLGPRTLQRLVEYTARKRIIDDAARQGIVTVPAMVVLARAATELNRRDRAERMKGGPGDRAHKTAVETLQTYRTQNYYRGQDASSRGGPLTVAQARNIRRRVATRFGLLELMSRGLATAAELRTYPPTKTEINEWAS